MGRPDSQPDNAKGKMEMQMYNGPNVNSGKPYNALDKSLNRVRVFPDSMWNNAESSDQARGFTGSTQNHMNKLKKMSKN
jgi:hypothetical protein